MVTASRSSPSQNSAAAPSATVTRRGGIPSGGGEPALEPVVEADLAQLRALGGDERRVVDRVVAVVQGVRVADDRARVVAGRERLPDELVHAEPLRAADLDDPVHGRAG